jgi:hypothetical protein
MINFTFGRINSLGAGTTRYSANSSSSQLTLDVSIYQQNINISGTFGNRNLSIYAKGLLFDKLSYRLLSQSGIGTQLAL